MGFGRGDVVECVGFHVEPAVPEPFPSRVGPCPLTGLWWAAISGVPSLSQQLLLWISRHHPLRTRRRPRSRPCCALLCRSLPRRLRTPPLMGRRRTCDARSCSTRGDEPCGLLLQNHPEHACSDLGWIGRFCVFKVRLRAATTRATSLYCLHFPP